MGEWNQPIPPDIRDRIRDLIGLDNPDPDDPLHKTIVNTVYRTRHMSHGDQLAAVEADLDWALLADGKAEGEARVAYEHLLAREKARYLIDDPRMSVAKATVLTEALETAKELQVVWRVAEARVSAIRALLRQVAGRRDTWRTHRADQRAADTAHAQGFGGHA